MFDSELREIIAEPTGQQVAVINKLFTLSDPQLCQGIKNPIKGLVQNGLSGLKFIV